MPNSLTSSLSVWRLGPEVPRVLRFDTACPEGQEPFARFFAECVLFRFDSIRFRKLRYLRYVDDIKLMSKDEVPIRRALVKLDPGFEGVRPCTASAED